MNPFDDFAEEVLHICRKMTGMQRKDISRILERPPEGIGADMALPCFFLASSMRKDPRVIAQEIAGRASKARGNDGLVLDVKAEGPYVNFYADWNRLNMMIIKDVISQGEKYGAEEGGGKILVEHTSANPDGPLHLGHFRNSVIGDSLARILEFSGNDVDTISFVNDTGRQIALAVREYMLEKSRKTDKKLDWWVLDLYLRGNRNIEKSPEIEDEVKSIIRDFESGDRKLKSAFHRITRRCIRGHKETLSRLGIKIGEFKRESDLLMEGDVRKILERVKHLPQGKTDGKRVWVDLSKFGVDREFTLTREDGTTIYPARDLAFHQYKFSKADKNVNVIGTDQKYYFKQIISTLGLLFPDKAKDYDVVFYEFLLLPEGSMSTRAGKFVAVDDAVEQAVSMAKKVVEEKMPHYTSKQKEAIARAVGIGALKFAMVKVSPEKTYSFDLKEALSFDGCNAPYIQYTRARAFSILRKAGKKKAAKVERYEANEAGRALVKHLARFPETAGKAAADLRPHYIARYAYELASKFNDFYEKSPVLKAKNEKLRSARLALVKAAAIVMKSSLGLLGIESPERM